MQQSAEDIGCLAEDFLSDDNRIVPFKLGENSKRYYKQPIACNFISYGNNVVAAVSEETKETVKEYISKFKFYHCFETPNMRWLNERLEPLGLTVCFMAEYYLPDLNRLTELPCEYELRILEKGQFDDLYCPQWPNALCSDKKHLDMLAIVKALYENGFDGYIRPDHGRMIWDEVGRPGYGLYDRALGAAYINGLWEAVSKLC